MAGHTFGGTDVQLVGVLAENVQDGLCFGYISQRCGSAMNVDIVDIFRMHACIFQGLFPSHSWPEAFRMRGGDVMRIGGGATAGDLTINFAPGPAHGRGFPEPGHPLLLP